MKVELLVPRASVDGSQNRGDIIDVDADEAARMIEAEQAIPVGSRQRKANIETAVPMAAVEKAVN